ncbi:MAG: hypothetical protein WBP38_02570 [Hyphomicrobium sp.]|nr:hypothetical protein [Hyphomicrobium sp.]
MFGTEWLTRTLVGQPTHHIDIIDWNGDSSRLTHSKRGSRRANADPSSEEPAQP